MEDNKIETKWKKKTTMFLISQVITLLGSSLVQFAIIWYVAKTTQSGTMIALQAVFSFVPQVIVSLFAGVWADRHNRKMLIVLSDGMIAIATLILALFMISGVQSMAMLLIISAVRSFGTGIQTPAVNALIPQIVPEEKLMKVNGINGSMMAMINLIAPAISAALLASGPIYNLLFIDVVTAVIGITILMCVPIASHNKASKKQKGGYFIDLKEGVKYSLKNDFVRRLLIVYTIFSILLIPAAALSTLFVTRIYGGSYLVLTLNEMLFSIGAIVGGAVLGTLGGFKNRMKTFVVGTFIFGITTFVVGIIKIFPLHLALIFFTGFSVTFINSPAMVMLQEKVKANMQGRVFSLIQIIGSATMPLGMAVYGPLADRIPIQWIMIGSGFAIIILGVFVRLYKKFYSEGETRGSVNAQAV